MTLRSPEVRAGGATVRLRDGRPVLARPEDALAARRSPLQAT